MTTEYVMVPREATAQELRGVLGVALELLNECAGPMEVAAAVLESEVADDGLERLIERVKKFYADASLLQAAPPAPAPISDEQLDELHGAMSDEQMTALARLRGGCSCHISPPCNACVEPLTEKEAISLGLLPDEPPPAPVAHSKSEYKRRVAMGDASILPPATVAVQPAPVSPSIYDALPPGAMDWLTSTDPRGAASREWQEGWDACRNRVHSQVDAAVAAPDASPSPAPVAAPVVTDAPQLPEGFRLLPVEATDSMMDAEWNVSMSEAHSNGGVSAAAWRAMVEAAPQVTYGDGHSGVGWYMHDTDYPEEGAVFLSRAILAAQSGAGTRGDGQ